MIHKSYRFIFIISCIVQTTIAQPTQSKLKIIERHDSHGIRLRWAPPSSSAWLASNKSGYLLEKIDLGDPTTTKSKIKMKIPVNLWPLDQWQTIVKKGTKANYPAIAAQMIYGKDWNKPDLSIAKKIDEQNNRYSYTLISADLSFETAIAAGLGYIDHDIIQGHKYAYKIQSLTKSYNIDTGIIVIDTRYTAPHLESPVQVSTQSGDKIINLLWSKANSKDFTAYYIERSDDGKSFQRLNDIPYLSSDFKEDSVFNNYYVYQDSVGINYKLSYYRIVGISPFGDESPTSTIVIGQGVDLTPPDQPSNVHTTQLGPHTLRVEWNYEYGSGINEDLKGFIIGRSTNVTEGYHPLNLTIIPPHTRFFIDDTATSEHTNFYIVAAIDTAGNNSLSLTTYGHLIDSIAPLIPKGLSGKVDSTGIVRLTWNANTEKDNLGYVLFSAHDSTHEFASVTNYHVLTNHYEDTIMVRSLTEQIYYKIVAVDKSFNYSKFSPVLTLQKPDLVNPSPPIFDNKQRDSNSVRLNWRPSSSKDVIKHQILRKSTNHTWEVVFETGDHSINQYTDKKLEYASEYEYKIRAVDDAGNVSDETYSYSFSIPSKPIDLNSLNLIVIKESSTAIIKWSPLPNVKSYLLYKSEGHGPYITLSKLTTTTFADKDINTQNSYSYRIQAISQDGSTSDFSSPVNFK